MANRATITPAPDTGAATGDRSLITWRAITLACLTGTLEALGIGVLIVVAGLTFLHPDHPLGTAIACVMEASR